MQRTAYTLDEVAQSIGRSYQYVYKLIVGGFFSKDEYTAIMSNGKKKRAYYLLNIKGIERLTGMKPEPETTTAALLK